MTVDAEVGGTRRRVDVRREGAGWLVTLDGRERHVDVAQAGERWSLLTRLVEAGPSDAGPDAGFRSYEISIESPGRGAQVVYVDGHAVPVSILDARAAFMRRGHEPGAHGASGPKAIVAPMPGRIVKVLVTSGDTVAARQGLVVIEAMKMENELRAPRAGTVVEVRVSEGSSVEANAILVVLE